MTGGNGVELGRQSLLVCVEAQRRFVKMMAGTREVKR